MIKEIENLTIKEAKEKLEEYKELNKIFGIVVKTEEKGCPYNIGKNYFIRTVTFHYTGKLKGVTDKELILEDVAWIADDGRFKEAVENGTFAEVEPYPKGEVIIGRGAILDATQIKFELPRKQK